MGQVRLTAVEPDLVWIDEELDAELSTHQESDGADSHWPVRDPIDWHLQAAELVAARRKVEERLPQQQGRVTIAHFDTGFSPCDDAGLPPLLDRDHSWDFTAMECDQKPCEPAPGGTDRTGSGLLKSRGHGTGTLSILAGGRVQLEPNGRPAFDGQLGGAPFAQVVEYRLADFVALWHPSVVASALRWAASNDVDVVSMSMGGPPTFALHQAVNDAYCHGVAMFTAAGNNFRHGLYGPSTPRTTVFPARYDRVISVGGITADRLTYGHRPWRWDYLYKPWQFIMRGNVGPRWVMDETIVAWTPNVPWLEFRGSTACNSPARISLDGAGTSAATPQVAAAAAQWLQYHSEAEYLRSHWQSWQKTEAVYQALLNGADKTTPDRDYNRRWFGQGILRAATALEGEIPAPGAPRPRARLGWDWIASLLLGDGVDRGLVASAAQLAALENMVLTEVAQLTITAPEVATILDDLDPNEGVSDARVRRRILERLAEEPVASGVLRRLAREQLEKTNAD